MNCPYCGEPVFCNSCGQDKILPSVERCIVCNGSGLQLSNEVGQIIEECLACNGSGEAVAGQNGGKR